MTSRDVRARTARQRRAYRSDLRTDQSAATRQRILEAALALGRAGKRLSVPMVAKEARVSVPTIYRHFPKRLDLLQALVTHVEQLVPFPSYDESDLHSIVRAFFIHRARTNRKLGDLSKSPTLLEVRRAVTVPRRRAFFEGIVSKIAPGIAEPDQTYLLDSLVVLISQAMANAFGEYLQYTAEETAVRVNWIVDALLARVKKGRR